MSEFKPAITATLKNEGFPGYSIDNNGAEVCAGINRHYWPGWSGWDKIDVLKSIRDKKTTNTELAKDPTFRALVEAFYQANFWTPMIAQINDQGVANWVFDKAVQAGMIQAVKLIQRAAGVHDDGNFGPKTLAEINGASPAVLLANAKQQAVAFYQELHQKDPVKYPERMVSRA